MSYDLPQAGLLQLVLFAEALSLRKHFGNLIASDVSLDGLVMTYDPTQQELHVERQAGYSRQTACLPVADFHSEMAGMTDICIVWAEASEHGPALTRLLFACADPTELEKLQGGTRPIWPCIRCGKSPFCCWCRKSPPAGQSWPANCAGRNRRSKPGRRSTACFWSMRLNLVQLLPKPKETAQSDAD